MACAAFDDVFAAIDWTGVLSPCIRLPGGSTIRVQFVGVCVNPSDHMVQIDKTVEGLRKSGYALQLSDEYETTVHEHSLHCIDVCVTIPGVEENTRDIFSACA